MPRSAPHTRSKAKAVGKRTKAVNKATVKMLEKVLHAPAARPRVRNSKNNPSRGIGGVVSNYRACLADPFTVTPMSLGLSGKNTSVQTAYTRSVIFTDSSHQYLFAMAQPMVGAGALQVYAAPAITTVINSTVPLISTYANSTTITTTASRARPIACGLRVTYRGAMTNSPPVLFAGLAPVQTNLDFGGAGSSWINTMTYNSVGAWPFTKMNFAESNTATAVWIPADQPDIAEFRSITDMDDHQFYVPFVMMAGMSPGNVIEIEVVAHLETLSGTIPASFFTPTQHQGGRYTANDLWEGFVKGSPVENAHFRPARRSSRFIGSGGGSLLSSGNVGTGSVGNNVVSEEKKFSPTPRSSPNPLHGLTSKVIREVEGAAEEAAGWVLSHGPGTRQVVLAPDRYTH